MRELDSILQKADATAARQATAEHPCWAVSVPNCASVKQSHKLRTQDLLSSSILLGASFFPGDRERPEVTDLLQLYSCLQDTENTGDLGVPYCMVWQQHSPFLLKKTFCLPGENYRIIE